MTNISSIEIICHAGPCVDLALLRYKNLIYVHFNRLKNISTTSTHQNFMDIFIFHLGSEPERKQAHVARNRVGFTRMRIYTLYSNGCDDHFLQFHAVYGRHWSNGPGARYQPGCVAYQDHHTGFLYINNCGHYHSSARIYFNLIK